jgi:radical SAM superfamily enzyme YgiQ (UPF0313 family)
LLSISAPSLGDSQIIDLQTETQQDYFRLIDRWQPDAIAYSCNYLANVPEIIDLAKETRNRLPDSSIMVGGHSASFTAKDCSSTPKAHWIAF